MQNSQFEGFKISEIAKIAKIDKLALLEEPNLHKGLKMSKLIH